MSDDGRFVVSGWSDGIVRFHTPETGKLFHEVCRQGVPKIGN